MDSKITTELNYFVENTFRSIDKKSFHLFMVKEETEIKIPSEIIQYVYRNRDQILSLIRKNESQQTVIDQLADESLALIYQHNQFIEFDHEHTQQMRNLSISFVDDLEKLLKQRQPFDIFKFRFEKLLRHYLNKFKIQISNILKFDDDVKSRLPENIVCEEYSPEFQLNILGIDINELEPPILDLGCGRSGNLVRHLNQKGLKAIGIDRTVSASEYLIQSDWTDFQLEPDFWGTIISHMGFSNHFVHHHLSNYGSPEKYADRYMQILKSLKLYGTFYYSPGLPHIESYLPAKRYLIKKIFIEQNYQSQVFQYLKERQLNYSSQVTRLA